jgi:hypothetical protein
LSTPDQDSCRSFKLDWQAWHAISPEGKFIVTIESVDDGSNVATYEASAGWTA